MNLTNDLVRGIYDYMGIPVILNPQGTNRPEYPYIGYTVISTGTEESQGNLDNEYVGPDIKASLTTPMRHTISFTAYSNKESEAYSTAKSLVDWFRHIGYDYTLEKEIVIVDVFPLENRDQLEVDEFERRYGFDVVFRTTDKVDRFDTTIETYTIKEG
jgi:hypothetical protein